VSRVREHSGLLVVLLRSFIWRFLVWIILVTFVWNFLLRSLRLVQPKIELLLFKRVRNRDFYFFLKLGNNLDLGRRCEHWLLNFNSLVFRHKTIRRSLYFLRWLNTQLGRTSSVTSLFRQTLVQLPHVEFVLFFVLRTFQIISQVVLNVWNHLVCLFSVDVFDHYLERL